jgi:hypothetical protein
MRRAATPRLQAEAAGEEVGDRAAVVGRGQHLRAARAASAPGARPLRAPPPSALTRTVCMLRPEALSFGLPPQRPAQSDNLITVGCSALRMDPKRICEAAPGRDWPRL